MRLDRFRSSRPRSAILRLDPGLATSPRVRYTFKWKEVQFFLFTGRLCPRLLTIADLAPTTSGTPQRASG